MTEEAEKAESPIEDQLAESSSTVRTIRSVELLQGAREVYIDHEGEIYRLRITRNQKLILQK